MRDFILRLALFFAVITAPSPAFADQKDIDVAARGVVRVVIIQRTPAGPVYFGHGTGFAVQPDKIVTNEHVIREVLRRSDLIPVVVPSEGDDFTGAKILRADARR
ncbi:MAG: serine protease, partial [Pseudomonadota bacterium]